MILKADLSLNKLIISNYYSFSTSMESKIINNKEQTLHLLKENNVPFHVEEHEQANTVNEGLEKVKTDKYKADEYTFCKNLFLKNKAGGFYLITAHHVYMFII